MKQCVLSFKRRTIPLPLLRDLSLQYVGRIPLLSLVSTNTSLEGFMSQTGHNLLKAKGRGAQKTVRMTRLRHTTTGTERHSSSTENRRKDVIARAGRWQPLCNTTMLPRALSLYSVGTSSLICDHKAAVKHRRAYTRSSLGTPPLPHTTSKFCASCTQNGYVCSSLHPTVATRLHFHG